MTQTARKIAQAFRKGEALKIKSTETNSGSVWLHGNRIAWLDSSGTLNLSLCGWETTTTRNRLNAICAELSIPARFHQVNHNQMFGDRKISSREIVLVPNIRGSRAA